MDPFEISIVVDGDQRTFLVTRLEEPDVFYQVSSADGDQNFQPRKFYADKENCSLRFPVSDTLDHDIASAISQWCSENKIPLADLITR